MEIGGKKKLDESSLARERQQCNLMKETEEDGEAMVRTRVQWRSSLDLSASGPGKSLSARASLEGLSVAVARNHIVCRWGKLAK